MDSTVSVSHFSKTYYASNPSRGFGERMLNTHSVILWKNKDDGSTVMSQRYATRYAEPKIVDEPPSVAKIVEAKHLLVRGFLPIACVHVIYSHTKSLLMHQKPPSHSKSPPTPPFSPSQTLVSPTSSLSPLFLPKDKMLQHVSQYTAR